MKFQPLQQPTPSSCGQTCVAMVVARPIEEVFEIMGKKGPTTGPDLRRALEYYGVILGPTRRMNWRLKIVGIPKLAIVRFHYHGHRKVSHWCLRHNGFLYDPASGTVEYRPIVAGGYITSFMEIKNEVP